MTAMSLFKLAVRAPFQFCWHAGFGQTPAHPSDEFIRDDIFPRGPFRIDSPDIQRLGDILTTFGDLLMTV